VVRLTASEVRKRIAQYYHQPEHAAELQIDLHPGSYVPVFHRAPQAAEEPDPEGAGGFIPRKKPAEPERALAPEELGLVTGHDFSRANPAAQYAEVLAPEGSSGVAPAAIHHPLRWLAGIAAVATAAAAALLAWNATQAAHTASRQLWEPILREPGQVQLVIADLSSSVSAAGDHDRDQAGALIELLRMGEMVNYRDTLASSGLVAFLAQHGKPYALQLSTQATYPDLQRGASVLVGGLDNVWTMRVTEPLRFHFVRRGTTYVYAIEDHRHPEMGGWNVDMVRDANRATEDFAIVARIFDQTTGRPVLVVAGLGANGTNAAAQFLLDPARTAELTAYAPRDWQRLNMEAVIRTQILDNHAGPPHLVTCTFW
jgi:hypothetical protein